MALYTCFVCNKLIETHKGVVITCCNKQMHWVSHKNARKVILNHLGFDTYQQYLESSLWNEIRIKVLNRDNHKCVKCKQKATQVHHKSYSLEVMKGNDIRPLKSICHRCHKFIEFHPDGKKTRLSTANSKLKNTYNPSAKYRSRPEIGRYYANKQKHKKK